MNTFDIIFLKTCFSSSQTTNGMNSLNSYGMNMDLYKVHLFFQFTKKAFSPTACTTLDHARNEPY